MGDEWSSDANEAVSIDLVEASEHGLRSIHKFHPKFTYPIFGPEERIFGYKGLKIAIRFSAHDLQPNISFSYAKKFTAIADTSALDIEAALSEFVPSSAFSKDIDYEESVRTDPSARGFVPPGRLVKTYTRGLDIFEIWAGSLLDHRVRDVIDRMQIFVSFFIEGGMPLNTTDVDWTLDRWTVYFVYQKVQRPPSSIAPSYSFIGYATTYRFYNFRPRYQKSFKIDEAVSSSNASHLLEQEISAASLPSRLRVSQFIILPPYQSSGHGSALYQAIYSAAMADRTVHELTVEDPSEEFDALRDMNDWKILEPSFATTGLTINTTPFQSSQKRLSTRMPTAKLLDLNKLKSIRSDKKIAPRQFARQLEMYLLSRVPYSHRAAGGTNLTKLLIQKSKTSHPDDKYYYWWRLIVKQRVYKKNRDVLLQLESGERHLRVEEAARAQEDEYEKLLLILAASKAKAQMKFGNSDSSVSGSGPVRHQKRKMVIDEEEEEEDASPESIRHGNNAKIAKTS